MKYSFHTMVSLANIGYSQLSVIMSDGCFLMMISRGFLPKLYMSSFFKVARSVVQNKSLFFNLNIVLLTFQFVIL